MNDVHAAAAIPLDVLLLVRAAGSQGSGFTEALERRLGSRHRLRRWDPALPAAGQLEGVAAVIDVGAHPDGLRVVEAGTPSLRLWQINGTGADHLRPATAWAERGVAVSVCPGDTGGQAVAEHAMTLLMALVRRLPVAEQAFYAGRWGEPFAGEIGGMRVAVVGLGASGRRFAEVASALGASVVPVTRDGSSPLGLATERAVRPEHLSAVLPRCDAISLHVPLTTSTHHLLDGRLLALLPDHAIVINVSRGAVLDEQAALDALRAGKLGGLGLDVFATEPAVAAPEPGLNLLRTPHVAGRTQPTAQRRAEVAATNLDCIANGQEARHQISLSQIYNS